MPDPSPLALSQNIRLPKEGRSVLPEFELAPDLVHLNHGSYGALPRCVLAEQQRWRTRIERDPTGFFQDEYPDAVRRSAAVAASCFGGDGHDWVFCENATFAVNSVLASLALEPGDEILATSHGYGAVLKAMAVWAKRRQAMLRIASLPACVESQDQVVDLVVQCFTDRTRLLVIDHITSPTAAVLPVKRIAAEAKRAGIAVLVDGAHGPGQIPLNVRDIGADWYTGNAHKWFFAPRGCGLLWTTAERQNQTFPAVLSHGTDRGYVAAFDWVGTRDVTPWLCLGGAAATHESFGGASLMARNRNFAVSAADIVGRALNAEASAPAGMRASMVSLRVGKGTVPEAASSLRKALHESRIVVPVSYLEGNLYVRLSAQIYNEMSDYERCAEALGRALSDLV